MSKVKVKVVIGSNYGDEGKGLATRYFSKQAENENKTCLNILYNGGCQRGHTVDLIDDYRHVFKHLGSGSFDSADTYFDQDFMVNPMIFIDELSQIKKQIQFSPFVYISPLCRVTTPYDMFINQIVETHRGKNKHGSCGCGIWETQQRYESGIYNLRYGELCNKTDAEILNYLNDIANDYLPSRLVYYGIKKIPNDYKVLIDSQNLAKHYLSDLREMQYEVGEVDDFERLMRYYDTIIFEGGQGLELDEENERAFPYVTASKTSSKIPIRRMVDYDTDIEICYVTRSYFTRHGAGYFPTECSVNKINSSIEDRTNVFNDFQEFIRYGRFDIGEFLNRVQKDTSYAKSIIPNVKTSLMVTHLNYTGDKFGNCKIGDLKPYFDNVYTSRNKFAEDIIRI